MVDRKLNDGDVQKLQTEVIDRYDNIRGSLAKLQGTIDMIEKAWTGQGANAFNVKQTEINGHMVAIGKMLDDFLEGIHMKRTLDILANENICLPKQNAAHASVW